MNRIVLYHNDADGFGAAYAAWQKFPTARFIPVQYGEPKPIFDMYDAEVYILDFSYSRDMLLKLKEQVGSLLVIDHHKTAEAELKGLDFCIFDKSKSGAVLTWEYFFPNILVPDLLLYIQDYDLWKFELPDSKEFSAGLSSYPFDFGLWKDIEQNIEQIKVEGKAILRFIQQKVERICQEPFIKKIRGELTQCINTSIFQSEVGHYLLEQYPNMKFSSSYFDTGNKRIYSLRSRDDFDCSEIAKSYGGGGHKKAAGFTQVL